MKQLIFTESDKCIGCNNCLRGCPAFGANRAFMNENNQTVVQVIPENCIHCGHCIEKCSYGARLYADDAEAFFTDLKNGRQISILVAPAVRSNFIGIYENLLGYLRHTGVNRILDVSFGADITTWAYLRHIEKNGRGAISQPCPAIVNFIESRVPQLIPSLMPVHSPVMCMAVYAKKYMNIPDDLALISPCIAKKDEIMDINTGGLVKYNITYRKLQAYLEDNHVNLESFAPVSFDSGLRGLGAMYSKHGGLREYIEVFTGNDLWIKQIEGEASVYSYIKSLANRKKESVTPHLVDILNCVRGCNFGSGTLNRATTDEAEYQQVKVKGEILEGPEKLKALFEKFDEELNIADFSRQYRRRDVTLRGADESELEKSFEILLKFEDRDRHINCHSCGFTSCSEMALALSIGLNVKENCVHYELLQNRKMMKDIEQKDSMLKEVLKEAQAANIAKSNFLSNMSHEIRTPMNAIIGMSELLKQERLTKRQRGFNNDIYESAHSLLSIINDILDFSKIEAGKIELNPVDYDFKALMDNIGSMFTYVAEKKGLEFKFECAGEMPHYLFGDDIRLRQALTNICGNAVKFTDHGYVRLKITVLAGKLMFEIKDTGRGISKEDAPKLFTAFQQADTSRNRNTTGTGLGLVISKSFVDMMGGSISFDSEYGQGTVFTIIIPMIAGDKNRVQHEKTVNEKFTMTAPSANILVVDDNEFNLRVASGLLNLFKIKADTAESGKEGIELVKRKKYDIVFMDHMMPEMDGIETAAAIRKLGEPYTKLSIIALTANAVQGAKEMFLANGFNDFISKPIDTHELNVILSTWLPPDKLMNEASGTDGEQEEQDEPDTEPASDVKRAFAGIYEINVEIGLSRVSGMEKMYWEAVALFTRKVVSECSHMAAYIETGDIGGFAVRVHAMKSMLSTIGAMGLSETAARLELAAKNKETAYCAEHYPSYQTELLALHEKLSVIFPDALNTMEKRAGDAAYLKEKLKEALEAADGFDGDACMKALEELLVYDYGEAVNAGLQGAATAIGDFDFDRVAEILRQL